ncbi:hypothetical protein HYH03_005900 [Edaphochlamys debaryana]|uniref:Presenilin n=1 Tax=Edaphochlamys debaryana TaxID=47281 RepID=A0A836C0L7_9CHLO|nr:hypothetical protein HYH03_005900 [Edaphochlamys debaryana]|eukprot:KAG2495971.1 hypothetical protein HYH03_005900 [Edaphochlamys debaryana]
MGAQASLILYSVLVAVMFALLPEWSTWTLLIGLVLYDMAVVLMPCGPLKAGMDASALRGFSGAASLVEMAAARQQDLPSLLYEARPAAGMPYIRGVGYLGYLGADAVDREPNGSSLREPTAPSLGAASSNDGGRGSGGGGGGSDDGSQPFSGSTRATAVQPAAPKAEHPSSRLGEEVEDGTSSVGGGALELQDLRRRDLPGAEGGGGGERGPYNAMGSSAAAAASSSISAPGDGPSSSPPPPDRHVTSTSLAGGSCMAAEEDAAESEAPTERQPSSSSSEFREIEFPDAIKLGLGDFIFYSVLVARSAMYSWMTAFAAYLGIVMGIVMTLLSLVVYHQVLPALPFSILMAAALHFVARYALEPFAAPLFCRMAYY